MNGGTQKASGQVTIGGSRGGVRDARPPLGVQILSISCSFRENLACSRPPWRVHAPPGGFTPPPRENPGSATGNIEWHKSIVCKIWISGFSILVRNVWIQATKIYFSDGKNISFSAKERDIFWWHKQDIYIYIFRSNLLKVNGLICYNYRRKNSSTDTNISTRNSNMKTKTMKTLTLSWLLSSDMVSMFIADFSCSSNSPSNSDRSKLLLPGLRCKAAGLE